MSAFVVNDEHIDALLTAGLVWGEKTFGPISWDWPAPSDQPPALTRETADAVGLMLLSENVRSVNARYREQDEVGPYRFQRLPGKPDPVVILKAIDCLEYQSNETTDWPESEAFAFCAAMRYRAIRELPGYDNGPGWNIDEREVFKA